MGAITRITPIAIDNTANYTVNRLSIVANVTAGNLTSNATITAVDAVISGNLTVSGTTTTVNSTTTQLVDPIFELGGGSNGAALTTDDSKDRGTLLHYYSGNATDAFMGWDNSNAEFAFGSNVSVSSEVVTFNTLGNVRAGYFIGNGSQLTGLPAGYANSDVANYLPTYTGNLTAGNANLGNAVTANFFVGNGSLLTGLPAGYTDSNVASYLPTYTGNITGNVANLTSLNVTGNVSLSGANISIGNASNLKITGGTANYILQTDGAGNLSWVEKPSAANINVAAAMTVDSFTGNGVQTSFTLSFSPQSENHIIVNVDGILQLKTAYSLSGTTLTFTSAPEDSVPIEVQTFAYTAAAASINLQTYTGNGVQTVFAVSNTATTNSVIVTENGIIQAPTTDYTVSNGSLTFVGAPANGISISIRELPTLTTSAAGTVTTNAQPNITSVGTLGFLSVAGSTNLGAVGNITITGGNAGQVLTTNGNGVLSFSDAASKYSSVSANTNLTAATKYIVDTSTSAITLTLPSSPTFGDEIGIIDGTGNANVNTITIARNGSNIQGTSSDLTVTTSRAAFTLVYYNVAQGWILTQV
jgi:hypothetical protein